MGALRGIGTSRRGDRAARRRATIANAKAREELRRIGDEQAALRQLAMLVIRGVKPSLVFAAVAEEVGALFNADYSAIVRFEPDGQATFLAGHGWLTRDGSGPAVKPDPSLALALVGETGCATRLDADDPTSPSLPEDLRAEGVRSAVSAPIVVEGRRWGTIGIASRRGPLPPGAEQRMTDLAELIAIVTANAQAHTELTEARARIVSTADETRRRIERDLHDGAQQRLVSLALQLRGAQATVPPELGELAAELDRVAVGLTMALDELRELARGVHPAILAQAGLVPALRTLARRSPIPVDLQVRTEGRLPERVEVTAYYIVSEALTNAAKHARASTVTVTVETAEDVLRVSVRDDGVGGADYARGTGLVGLGDRVEALSGQIFLNSPRGAGTTLRAELPLTEPNGVTVHRARSGT
ncbi:MAG TPA: GAF domain-containing sensor histidine kinase [Dactylosporangium sp.]|nr:GAF domain-containing sensor histidine kinase [Dactylosporangium sp.]